MKGLNPCLNSQTPLIRFKLQYAELLEKYGELPDPVPLDMLIEGEDYEMSPGVQATHGWLSIGRDSWASAGYWWRPQRGE